MILTPETLNDLAALIRERNRIDEENERAAKLTFDRIVAMLKPLDAAHCSPRVGKDRCP